MCLAQHRTDCSSSVARIEADWMALVLSLSLISLIVLAYPACIDTTCACLNISIHRSNERASATDCIRARVRLSKSWLERRHRALLRHTLSVACTRHRCSRSQDCDSTLFHASFVSDHVCHRAKAEAERPSCSLRAACSNARRQVSFSLTVSRQAFQYAAV